MILEFDMTYSELRKNPDKAKKGMNILDITSPKLTRFIVVDVINGCPVLIQNGDAYNVAIPTNTIGDYMLNLRTGYISIIDSSEHHISKPVADMKMDDCALSLIRKDFNI